MPSLPAAIQTASFGTFVTVIVIILWIVGNVAESVQKNQKKRERRERRRREAQAPATSHTHEPAATTTQPRPRRYTTHETGADELRDFLEQLRGETFQPEPEPPPPPKPKPKPVLHFDTPPELPQTQPATDDTDTYATDETYAAIAAIKDVEDLKDYDYERPPEPDLTANFRTASPLLDLSGLRMPMLTIPVPLVSTSSTDRSPYTDLNLHSPKQVRNIIAGHALLGPPASLQPPGESN